MSICYSIFLLVSFCMEYLFTSPSFHSVCFLISWVGLLQRAFVGVLFSIHSASLCLFVGVLKPFPFKIIIIVCMCDSSSMLSDSLEPHGLLLSMLLCPWNSSGMNTEVGFHSHLQGIFPTQESNLSLLQCQQIQYIYFILIFLIALDLFLYIFHLPFLFCDLMTKFSVVFGFLLLLYVCINCRFLICSYHEIFKNSNLYKNKILSCCFLNSKFNLNSKLQYLTFVLSSLLLVYILHLYVGDLQLLLYVCLRFSIHCFQSWPFLFCLGKFLQHKQNTL